MRRTATQTWQPESRMGDRGHARAARLGHHRGCGEKGGLEDRVTMATGRVQPRGRGVAQPQIRGPTLKT